MDCMFEEPSSGEELLNLMPYCIDPQTRRRRNEDFFPSANSRGFLKKRSSTMLKPCDKICKDEDIQVFLETKGGPLDVMWQPFYSVQKRIEEAEKEKCLSSMGFSEKGEVNWLKVNFPKRRELHNIMHYRICHHINPDIVVVIEDHEFFCHRIVLQSYSELFDEYKNLEASNHVDLTNKNVTKNAFIIIYTWMLALGQEGCFQLLKKDNILEVLMACQSLRIKDFENQCLAFIDNEELFNEENAFFLFIQASNLKHNSVVDLMLPRIQGFFLTLVSSKDFLELSLENLCIFLNSDYIIVHCELEVFMSGVRWLKHNWKERSRHLMRVMRCIRFGQMTPLELIDIRNNPQCEFADISQEEEIQKLIDEGLAVAVKNALCMSEDARNCLLDSPPPRNWQGNQKTYKSYQEFLELLREVRRKPRMLYKKKEKMRDDFSFSDSGFIDEPHQKAVKNYVIAKHTESSRSLKDAHILADLALSVTSSCENVTPKKTRDFVKESNNTVSSISNMYLEVEGPKRVEKGPMPRVIEELTKKQQGKLVPKESEPEVLRSSSKTSRRLSLKHSAATVIQAAFRGFVTRKRLKEALRGADKRSTEKQQLQQAEDNKLHINEAYIPVANDELAQSETQSNNQLSPPGNHLKREFNGPGSLFFLYQESILVFGGIDPNYHLTVSNSGSTVYRYHPDENMWETASNMPEPRYYHCVAQLKGKVYLSGGSDPRKEELNENAVCKTMWSFDPVTRLWSTEADMLTARKNFGLVSAHGFLYAIGGQDKDDKVLASVEKYDPSTKEWTMVCPLGEARVGAAICKHNHMIWVAGGVCTGGKQTISKYVECYDPKRNVWIPKAPLRFPRAFSAMLSLKGSLYIVGGASREGSTTACSTPTIDVWDERNKEWKLKTEMSIPRHGHTVSYIGSQMVILGGSTTIYMRCLPSVEAWCVARGTWIRGVTPLPAILTGHSSITLPLGAQPS